MATGVNVSKANDYGVLAPPKGVSASKGSDYAVLAPPKGVAVAKANLYVVVEGPVYVAQVAEEIAYTRTDATVQVAQAAQEIAYTKTDAPVEVAQVAQEIVYTGSASVQVAQVAQEIIYVSNLHYYTGAGDLYLNGTGTYRFEPSENLIEHYTGAGDLILNGEAATDRTAIQWHYTGAGNFELGGGETYWGDVGIVISQVALAPVVESDEPASVSQVTAASVINSEAYVDVSQVTLVIVWKPPPFVPPVCPPEAEFFPAGPIAEFRCVECDEDNWAPCPPESTLVASVPLAALDQPCGVTSNYAASLVPQGPVATFECVECEEIT